MTRRALAIDALGNVGESGGASATQTGLGSAKAPEPCGLGPTGAIPSAFTPGPWDATYFTRPDGSEIETVEHVAETTAYSARQCRGTTLHGVTLTGEQDGVVVCYTGNGPTSEANARLIAAAPELFEALDRMLLEFGSDIKAYDGDLYHLAYDILARVRGDTQ